MSKQLLAKNVPADEIDEMVSAFENLGATYTRKETQPDGTFDVIATFSDYPGPRAATDPNALK